MTVLNSLYSSTRVHDSRESLSDARGAKLAISIRDFMGMIQGQQKDKKLSLLHTANKLSDLMIFTTKEQNCSGLIHRGHNHSTGIYDQSAQS